MRALFHPKIEDLSLHSLLYALSDPIRLKMLSLLSDERETSCSLIELKMPKSSMSYHFKVLRESGLVRTRVEGTHRYMTLRSKDLEKCFPGVLSAVLKNVANLQTTEL